MPLTDRTAIVTGGSSGIGRGIAKGLAADGATVVIADVQQEPKQGEHYDTDVTTPTDELVQAEYDVPATFVRTDVANEADVEALVERTVERFGSLDILVNNAGILIPGGTQDLSFEDWQRVVDVNLTGQFLTAKHAIPHLVDSNQGRIINISSVNAHFGGAGPPYASTKAAIINLTRDLAVELAPDEVTVNAVLPGVIRTPMQDLNDDETIERQEKKTPLPRLGRSEDVANAVRFLASDRAEWITGTQLPVDGGYLAGGY
jgi:NAD(P)-dependent dehydrogenase (short-subunit alcohol dehydrogenase family)